MKGKPPGPPPGAGGPGQAPPGGDKPPGGEAPPGGGQIPSDGAQTPQNRPGGGSDSQGPPKEQEGPKKPFFDGTRCVVPIKIEDFINAMSVLYLKVGWKPKVSVTHTASPGTFHTGC